MAFVWSDKIVGTLKGRVSGTTKNLNVNGISTNILALTPTAGVTEVNTILDIGGKSITVDENLSYSNVKGVVEND